jgi:hypothetical protein
MKKARKVIANHCCGMRRKMFNQSAAVLRFRFNVCDIERIGLLCIRRIVDHSVQNKLVKAVTRPAVIASQGFQDNQWLLNLLSDLYRSLQSKV